MIQIEIQYTPSLLFFLPSAHATGGVSKVQVSSLKYIHIVVKKFCLNKGDWSVNRCSRNLKQAFVLKTKSTHPWSFHL